MKKLLQSFLYLPAFFLPGILSGSAQTPAGKGLFESDDILEITLSGDIRTLLNDRGDDPKYHPVVLSYKKEDSTQLSVAVKMKTRGHFRKLSENCYYAPLLINFSKSDTLSATVFKGNDKLKLVMPCGKDDYVIREWLIYKLYNLVTPKSFGARLVRVILNDQKNKKINGAFYGILLEEEKQVARRNKSISISKKMKPSQTDTTAFCKMAVFQYLVGNTDWSVEYLQNIKLIATDSNATPIAVPYDFDHAGLVDAPYALPAQELNMYSTRERRYRGYCITDMKVFDETIALYSGLKKDIYALFTGCKLLDARYIKSTEKFLDEFYETINNPKKVQSEFGYPCDKYGTGNVIIKGMRDE